VKTVRIASDDVELELLPELGGRWHRLRAFGRDLLRTPDDLDAYRREPFFWGAYVMAPWCNRLTVGPRQVADRAVDLAPNFPDGTAIHGQVYRLPWDATPSGTLRVAAGGAGWPWRYDVQQRIELDGRRLVLIAALTNRSGGLMPAGIGIHPWFRQPLELSVAAERVFTSNEASTSHPVPVDGDHDLRRARAVPPDLDATWTDLRGSVVAAMRWPDLGISASMRVSPEGAYLCAASPAALGAVAVEPQTHAPDGLRRLANGESGALQLLEPSATLQLAVELEFAQA